MLSMDTRLPPASYGLLFKAHKETVPDAVIVATISDDLAFSRVYPKKERGEDEDEFFGEE